VTLANLLVEIGEPNAKEFLRYIIQPIQNWTDLFQRALLLADLTPCVSLFEQPERILDKFLGKEPVRSIVQVVWEAEGYSAEQIAVLLQSIEAIRDRLSDANVALLARTFKALASVLALPEHDELMEQAIVLSETFLPDIERAEFLAKLVLAVSPRADRERILGKVQELLTSSSTEMKDRLLLRVAPVLAPLARPSDQCLVSLVQQSFNANRSSGRAFVLYQIERLSPLIKALGGCELAGETWKRIQTVEGLFQLHSGHPLL
jgi:hypothetical protein